MATELITGVGRLVQGSCFRPNAKKDKAGKVVLGEDLKPIESYYIGVAFRKDDQDFLTRIYPAIVAEARLGWPEHFSPPGTAGTDHNGCRLRNFAYKVMDGDGIDDNGKPNAEKPGFAGHWVLKCSIGAKFGAPQVYNAGQLDPMQVIRDEQALKLGYFVQVAINIKGNRPSQSPGVYVNFNVLVIAAHCPPDQIIVVGPDARTLFAGAPPANLPAGAIAVGSGVAAPGGPGGPAPIAPRGPATHIPAAPALAPAFTMLPLAGTYTREQYHETGWTDDALIAGGYMVANGPKLPSGPGAQSTPPGPASPATSAPAPGPANAPSSPSNPGFVAGALAQYAMTSAADGYSREQYLAQGWTDADLLAQGKMVKQ